MPNPSASESSPEVEAKLTLPGDVYWLLRDNPSLLGVPIVGRAFERQTNLYYETAEGSLRHAGAVLRARRIAGRDGVEWTYKSARRLEGGIQTADELVAWGPDGDDPISLAGGLSPVTAALAVARGPLRVDAGATTERTILRVEAPAGGEIEVSLDRLRIPGDAVFVDYELEAEARGASRADVEALATVLMERFGLSPATEPKRARLQAYSDLRLGPDLVSETECLDRLIGAVSRRTSSHAVLLHLAGLTGSPVSRLAREIERKLALAGLSCEVSTTLEHWHQADDRLWVASSVQWRLLRWLASSPGRIDSALEEFRRRTEAVDRRTLEWHWHDADVVVLADEPSVPDQVGNLLVSGTSYRPDDLSPTLRGRIRLEPSDGGSRVTFTANSWPDDLAAAPRSFAMGAPVTWVATLLADSGYAEALD